MSQIAAWVHTPLAAALGWSLVHFLWEGALLAGVLAVSLALAGSDARRRYAISCAIVALMPMVFAATFAVLWLQRPASGPVLGMAHIGVVSAAAVSAPMAPRLSVSGVLQRLAWLAPLWMLGVVFFYARGLAGWLAVRQMRSRGAIAAPFEWQQRLDWLSHGLGVTRPVVLLESLLTKAPVMIGYLRPAVLLPVGCLTGMSADQIEYILLHELVHIRRHDYLVALLQSGVEGLLFYHPAVWWASSVVRREREFCCDDAVVETMGDARSYAATLAMLEARRAPTARSALAVTGGELMRRIRRLTQPKPQPASPMAPALSASMLLVLVAAGLLAVPLKRPAPVSFLPLVAAPLQSTVSQTQTPAPQRQATLSPSPAPVIRRPRFGPRPLNYAPQPGVFGLGPREATAGSRRSGMAAVKTVARRRTGSTVGMVFQTALATPYRKWLEEDVAYLIGAEERQAFLRLESDEEREAFIENFWSARGVEVKQEHYRRIAYSNLHYGGAAPGWRSDRGRIYIVYGPASAIEDRPRRQVWIYRSAGGEQRFVFDDVTATGAYVLVESPKR